MGFEAGVRKRVFGEAIRAFGIEKEKEQDANSTVNSDSGVFGGGGSKLKGRCPLPFRKWGWLARRPANEPHKDTAGG